MCARCPRRQLRPKLLVIELWGLGDLAVATPFLRAAAEKFSVTLLAKPHAAELQARFWPEVNLVAAEIPWTAFRDKYKLTEWPWRKLAALRRVLAAEKFDWAVSARHDPRDHFLMQAVGADRRAGFPRLGSAMFLTDPLDLPRGSAHRYDFWRAAGGAMGLQLPARGQLLLPRPAGRKVMVHSGARLPARVWSLERYAEVVRRLRGQGYDVQVVCDPPQADWWRGQGEAVVAAPKTLAELFAVIDTAGVFIGNCSGPGHLAAVSGVPTFTIFGPSMPGEFLPIHPAAEFVEDFSCEFRPCQDYCHFDAPKCLLNISAEQVWPKVEGFVGRNLGR